MKVLHSLVILAVAVMATPAMAQQFVIGMEGCCDSGVNQWPGAEGPQFAIDGVGQKYLNFGEFNTGVAVTPASSAVPTSIQVWTANDEEPTATQLALPFMASTEQSVERLIHRSVA